MLPQVLNLMPQALTALPLLPSKEIPLSPFQPQDFKALTTPSMVSLEMLKPSGTTPTPQPLALPL